MLNLNTISEFVVRVADLIEAEGRSLRAVVSAEMQTASKSLATAVLAAVMLLASGCLLLAGLGLLALALEWWLESFLSRHLAVALTGVALIALASVCLLWVRAITRCSRPPIAPTARIAKP